MIPILISHILRTNLRGLDNLFMDKGKIYTFLNPVSYLMALDRKDLFGQFDGIFADGSILVAAIRLLYGITVKRRSFDMTSMAPELFRFAENNGKMLYIVASKQEQVEKAVEIFKERYPKLKFMGCRNGVFFRKVVLIWKPVVTCVEILCPLKHWLTAWPLYVCIHWIR